jgi:hypothetical protein
MSYQKSVRTGLCAVVAAVALVATSPVGATTILPGGGPAALDCLGVFETPVTIDSRLREIRCVDGDPNCDADGVVNGECKFAIAVCANSATPASCTVQGVQSMFIDHSDDNGDPRFDPDFQALQSRIDNQINPPNTDPDQCTSMSNVTVKLKGPFPGNRCRENSKRLKLTSSSTFQNGHFYTDSDALRLICRPAADSCDPSKLYSGTFDRIQKQIFNNNCALSGCHDSQTMTGGMLLEVGAAYTQIVGVTPHNPVAAGMGWERIFPNDPTMSFMYHKITGDLGPGLGSRMPLGRPQLPANLIDIMRLWIEAGAPMDGWVPGTDS